MKRRVLPLLLAVSALSCGAGAAAAQAAQPEEPLRLHATRGADPGIFDSRGSEVLLRGVNVNQLAEYYQANQAWPTVEALNEKDFQRIAGLGFNSVRLLMSWSRLEPQRGQFSAGYLKRVSRAVGWAEAYGLHVVLDMHQDAWGPHVDTKPGELCPPGSRASVGWDGAPLWATLSDGLSTCSFGFRETAPAVTRAWQSFYEDREGIRSELVRTWAFVARRFAAEPTVAGYDLLNEPNPGSAAGNDTVVLGEFYGDAIDAIRKAERGRSGGFAHIVFFEPSVLWSALGDYQTPPPDFTADRNIVFAPHIYAEAISPNTILAGFESAREAAATYGVTVWSGEYGFFDSEPERDRDPVTRYGLAEDGYLYGGAWWSWKQACGDPHVISTPGGQPNALSPNLNRYECLTPPGRALGIPGVYKRALSRPTVRAAPGRILTLQSDADAGSLLIEGKVAKRRCGLRAFSSGDRGRPTVTAKRVSGIEVDRVLGDWIVSGCARGSYSLRFLR